jgi:hypothetical protein
VLPDAFETDVLQAYAVRALTDERLSDLLRLETTDAARLRALEAGVDPPPDEVTAEELQELLDP